MCLLECKAIVATRDEETEYSTRGENEKNRVCLLLTSEAVNGLLSAMWQIDLKCLLDRLATLLRLLLL